MEGESFHHYSFVNPSHNQNNHPHHWDDGDGQSPLNAIGVVSLRQRGQPLLKMVDRSDIFADLHPEDFHVAFYIFIY